MQKWLEMISPPPLVVQFTPCGVNVESLAFRDPTFTLEERGDDLVSPVTVEEKFIKWSMMLRL